MKKLSITFILYLISLINLTAQEDATDDSKKVTFGLKGGLNLATPSGYFIDETKSKLNYHIGAYAEFKLSKKFALQPELQYSVQGAEIDFENPFPLLGAGDFVISDTYNYLNLSLMGKYFIIDKLSLEAGPQIGYLLSAERDFEFGPITSDLNDNANRLDFGVNFGLGYKINKHINFGVRYNLGLVKVVNSPSGNPQEGFGQIKNSVFQASIGYSF